MNENGQTSDRVIVVGAGIGGLCSAIALSAAGFDVTVIESRDYPGGKMREVPVGGLGVDSGPTVFTMKWVFDELFEKAGLSFDDRVALAPAHILARHGWRDGSSLDLFSNTEESVAAIGEFAGRENAEGYRRFAKDSERVFETLKRSYIAAPRPSPVDLVGRIGPLNIGDMLALKPFDSLWKALGGYFSDPRLQQLFGRYATYCGSSPYRSPATLMLVAHVEQDGVWFVAGGMHALAQALGEAAQSLGATFRYGERGAGIAVDGGVSGVTLTSGERLEAGAVIFNGDASALARMLPDSARAPKPVPAAKRSLSAQTWSMRAKTGGFPLSRHTVFFSDDYRAEFDTIFDKRGLPEQPTVYICAQDRDDIGNLSENGSEVERLLCLINAPADGDTRTFEESEVEEWLGKTCDHLDQCGLLLDPISAVPTGPAQFEQLFPGSGGALYGRASHGWMASFQRQGSRTKVPGLYLAGGSVHPGPGVPMAALSGRLAAESLVADRVLTPRFRPVATSGGISTG